MNDLIIVANIILDCDEMIKASEPVLDYIKQQCRKHGIQHHQDDIIKIASRVTPVYNIGKVKMDYGDKNLT